MSEKKYLIGLSKREARALIHFLKNSTLTAGLTEKEELDLLVKLQQVL